MIVLTSLYSKAHAQQERRGLPQSTLSSGARAGARQSKRTDASFSSRGELGFGQWHAQEIESKGFGQLREVWQAFTQ